MNQVIQTNFHNFQINNRIEKVDVVDSKQVWLPKSVIGQIGSFVFSKRYLVAFADYKKTITQQRQRQKAKYESCIRFGTLKNDIYDNNIKVTMSVKTSFEYKTFGAGVDEMTCRISMSPDGKIVATYSTSGYIYIFDTTNNCLIDVNMIGYSAQTNNTLVMHVTNEYAIIGFAVLDIVMVLKIEYGKQVSTTRLTDHPNYVEGLRLSGDGNYILGCRYDANVSTWNISTEKRITLIRTETLGNDTSINDASISHGGAFFCLALHKQVNVYTNVENEQTPFVVIALNPVDVINYFCRRVYFLRKHHLGVLIVEGKNSDRVTRFTLCNIIINGTTSTKRIETRKIPFGLFSLVEDDQDENQIMVFYPHCYSDKEVVIMCHLDFETGSCNFKGLVNELEIQSLAAINYQ